MPHRVPFGRLVLGTLASTAVLAGALALSGHGSTEAQAADHAPGQPAAGAEPPTFLAPYIQAAAACPGLDPLLLVAIHDVETGRDSVGATSSAGAVGPMQFMADTWTVYGVDADGDGAASPLDLTDALVGATQLLCANGASDANTRDMAIWNYNHSWAYVGAVTARTDELRVLLGGP
jgi:hypothetical protein